MPGVLIMEALAQAGAVAILSQPENKGKLVLFGGIDGARFKGKVVPGDVLMLETEIIKVKRPGGRGQCKGHCQRKAGGKGGADLCCHCAGKSLRRDRKSKMIKQLQIGDLTARFPVIQGGMGVGVSLSGLAGAVAAQGGIGIISTAQIGYREPDYQVNPHTANLRAVKKGKSGELRSWRPAVLWA